MSYHKQLYGWTDLVSAGASIFDSYMDSRTAKSTNETMQTQMQMQYEAQRLQAESNERMLKYGLIGGGALLLGGVLIIAMTRTGK